MMKILKSKNQVSSGRKELRQRQTDCASSFAEKPLRRFGLIKGVDVGDRGKSWDVLQTVRFLEEHLPKDVPILDLGARGCEILPILHRLGYSDLTGIDLDAGILKMPHADDIRYLTGDFLRMNFEGRTFGGITAISVIEHGFDSRGLLGMLSRALMPGEFFVASGDYWPEKIDTTGSTAYGMVWIIFSREEIVSFIEQGKGFGLHPVGDMDFEARERVVNWGGRRYNFAWMTIQKDTGSAGTRLDLGEMA
jgi:SAM-dependent methyltransferase